MTKSSKTKSLVVVPAIDEAASSIGRVYSAMSSQDRPDLHFKNATEANIFALLKMLFTSNKTLIHCDLSHTGLSKQLVTMLVQLLKDNPDTIQNLRGLHLTIDDPKTDKAWLNEIREILGECSDCGSE